MADHEMPKTLGGYQLVRELGHGAMGVVYEGIDPVIGRRVAIKVARPDVLQGSEHAEELMERFLREARAAGIINHPNVITIYKADIENGVAFIAMEYIEGGTLRDLLHAQRCLPPHEVARIGAEICRGLAAAHQHGIVHRDIKPGNIMILPDGAVKVADFGIARLSDSNLTMEGAMIGTPYFMSPEQFTGRKIDERSDIFSVGVLLYEMLTGERPFVGESLTVIMHQVLEMEPVAPEQIAAVTNPILSRIILKALSKDPDFRYQKAADLAVALVESVKSNPDPALLKLDDVPEAVTVHLRPDQPTVLAAQPADAGLVRPTPVLPPRPKRNWLVAAIAGTSFVILAVTTYFLVAPDEAKKPSGQTPPAVSHGAPQPAFARLNLMVWLADTREAWITANNLSITDVRSRYALCRPGAATVTVKDAETGETLASGPVSDEPMALQPLRRKITVSAVQDGYEEMTSPVLEAKQPGEARPIDIVLKKKGI